MNVRSFCFKEDKSKMNEDNIRQAVVLVLKNNKNEIFVIERQEYLRAFPGYLCFPGGKVEENETQEQALAREIFEELNVEIDVTKLKLIGHALTPSIFKLRFDTFFYELKVSKLLISPNADEIADSFWAKPEELVSNFMQNKSLVIAPIQKIFNYYLNNEEGPLPLELIPMFDQDKVPMIESLYGLKQILPLSNTLPPAVRTNAYITDGLLIDPSPKDEIELKKFLKTIEEEKVNAIFITHHHPDHHEYSNQIAETLSLPMYMSETTYNYIQRKHGIDYFKDIKISFLSEGDVFHGMKVFSLPGHDQGQLGLYNEKSGWFLASDLLQGQGPVVIGGEEGDLALYMKSLERVIALGPKYILQSHGIILKGVFFISKVREHRIKRHNQILELFQAGLTNIEILAKAYKGTPKKLHKYALLNIEAHLDFAKNHDQKLEI
ncbi:MAG: ribonuclease/clavin/mitogillin [Thermoproteota archaeon]|jgi:ribonuclease/clavin/mitogillin